MTSLLHHWQIVGVGIHVASDGGWSLIPREIVAVGGVPGVQGGSVYSFLDDTSSCTSRHWPAKTGATSSPQTPKPRPPGGGAHTYEIFSLVGPTGLLPLEYRYWAPEAR